MKDKAAILGLISTKSTDREARLYLFSLFRLNQTQIWINTGEHQGAILYQQKDTNMRVFVTGATGFVSTAIIQELLMQVIEYLGRQALKPGPNIWRQSAPDGIYSPLAKEVRPVSSILFASNSKRIGTLFAIESSAAVSRNFSLGANVDYFVAGCYTKETGRGKDISYGSVKATIKLWYELQ